jgi:hypothetical protein
LQSVAVGGTGLHRARPRAIETGVDWVTSFIEHARRNGVRRFEARAEAEKEMD